MKKTILLFTLVFVLISTICLAGPKTKEITYKDNTEKMQDAISAHNPNNIEFHENEVIAGSSGNIIIVDPLYVCAD